MFAPAPSRDPQPRGTPLSRSRTPRTLVPALAVALVATLAAVAPAAAEPEAADVAVDPGEAAAVAAARVAPTPVPEPATLTNPVSAPFADSYADPAVLRGKDGWWYAYATSDPLVSDGEFGLMHMARTRDFAEWEYLGTVFDESTRPAWAAEGSFFWAPDVRFVDGEYRLYYTVTDSAAKPGDDPGIGMATAPTPAGPWTDIGRPVVESEELPTELLRDDVTPFEIDETGGAATAQDQAQVAQEEGVSTRADDGDPAPPSYAGLIDPSLFVDDDGRVYMYVGGFAGGPQVVELDETGTRTVGELQQVAVSDRYEGSYVLRRGDFYYLMLSAAGCCSAVASGYSVFVGRSESPLGPFVDAEGVPLADSRAGGTQVLASNGNRWVGVGHHAVMTDTTGQDWMVYHGIDREDGWLSEPGGINKRPMLVDRMDWIDGWPVVNAGAGPSEGPIPGPVLGSAMGITTDDPASNRAFRALTGRFASVADDDGDAGQVGELRPARRAPAVATARELLRGENRFETDVRLDPGAEVCVRVDGWRRGAEVCLDDGDRTLTSSARGRDDRLRSVAPVPDRIDLQQWHTLVVTLDAEGVRADLQESRLADPVAVATVPLPARGGTEGVLLLVGRGGSADVDNLSVAPLAPAPPPLVPDPEVGDVVAVETFDRDLEDVLADGWELSGEDPGVAASDGALSWPLTDGDLTSPDGGPALLREAPEGDWVLETDLRLDVGTDTVRNFQQGGLVVDAGPDQMVRLSSVALGESRVVEFLTRRDADGVVVQGGHLDGPPATDITLRILRTSNEAGEQLYRSAFSVDGGQTWRWGMTWTLPAGTDVRIGLQAGGGADPATTAFFDEVRLRTT